MTDKWMLKFNLLWAGQTISIFTSSIIQMTIVWYLIATTKSPSILTLAVLVGYFPQAIIGMFAGTIIDKFKKKRIMIVADGFVALVTFSLFIMFQFNLQTIPFIFFVLFLRGIGNAFHTPSLHSFIPLIVPKDKLVKYAGYAKGFESFSDLLSPAIAATLYAVLNIKFIFILDIIGAVFAIGILLFIKVDEPQRVKQDYHYLTEFKDGLKVIKNNKTIMTLILISALYAIIYPAIGTLYPFIAIEHFKVGVQGSAIVETTFAIGTLIGSLLLGWWGYRLNKILAIAGSITLYGICVLLMGLIPINQHLLFYSIALIMGISIPFYHGVQTALIQIKIPFEYLGRVLGTINALTRFTMPISLLAATSLVSQVGIANWYAISGILCFFLAALAFSKRKNYE